MVAGQVDGLAALLGPAGLGTRGSSCFSSGPVSTEGLLCREDPGAVPDGWQVDEAA